MSSRITMKRDGSQSTADEFAQRSGASEHPTDDTSQLESLVRMVSVESLVRMVAGVAHELKNPLGILLMGTEYLAKKFGAEDSTSATVADDMREAVGRADAIVRALVQFAATKPLVRDSENLNPEVEAALLALEPELRAHGIAVSLELANGLPALLLDRTRVQQAIVNVLNNAIDAMPDGGSLFVRTFAEAPVDDRDAGPAIRLTIEDTGPGIPERLLGRVVLPFFTTKKSGKDAGLGLTIAQTIFQAHGGTISIENRESGGVLVSVTFALRGATAVPAAS